MQKIENILYKVNEKDSFRANVYTYFLRSHSTRYYVLLVIQPILLVRPKPQSQE